MRFSAILSAVSAITISITLHAADRYTFTHLAGGVGGIGYRDDKGSAARFYEPTGLDVDRQGNIFVSDYGNHVVRKVTPQGDVTTLAGLAGQMGFQNGIGSGARFHCPYSPAVAANGDIYLSDSDNHVIRRITSRGEVITLAGNGTEGSENGTGSAARFDEPYGLTFDPAGNIIVADSDNNTIRRVTRQGEVTTIAGSAGQAGFADGRGSDARFDHPTDVAVATDGSIYVADENNSAIRRVDSSGNVTTIAGSPMAAPEADGPGATAHFDHPLSIAIDAAGVLYVADVGGHTIRRIGADQIVTTLAGMAATPGSADGRGSAARFRGPSSVRMMPNGSLAVADTFNDEVRVVAQDGTVTTLAGLAAEPAYADGVGAAVRFDQPDGIAMDGTGRIAVSDSNNHVIRAVTLDGAVSLLSGSPQLRGFADGIGSDARFTAPAQISFGINGELYVADSGNAAVRLISPSEVVSTLAGAGMFLFPSSVARGPSGAIYVADRNNHVIRRIQNGQVTIVAGTPAVAGASDGPAASATFDLPQGIVSDANENLYVADYGNHTIRKISNSGKVTTFAGAAGQRGSADGNGAAARFNFPTSLTIDGDGFLFVTDSVSDTVRRVSPAGDVITIAGTAGTPGSTDGTATNAQFNAPYAIAAGGGGDLLVADRNNHAIRIGRIASSDRAAIDAAAGPVGAMRALTVADPSGTTFHWALIRRPSTSSAPIQSADSSVAYFTPDVADLFEFELTASGPRGTSITTVTLSAFETRRRAVR